MGEVTIHLDAAEAEILLDHHRLNFGGALEELGDIGRGSSLRETTAYEAAKADVDRRERIMRELGWGAETLPPVEVATEEDELRAAALYGMESVASALQEAWRVGAEAKGDEEYVALAQDAERRLKASRAGHGSNRSRSPRSSTRRGSSTASAPRRTPGGCGRSPPVPRGSSGRRSPNASGTRAEGRRSRPRSSRPAARRGATRRRTGRSSPRSSSPGCGSGS